MKDTSLEMEKIFRDKMMANSGVTRLKMGCSMFDTAKVLIQSSFKNQGLPLSGPVYREKLFLRIYGNDFNEETKTKIISHLKKCGDF